MAAEIDFQELPLADGTVLEFGVLRPEGPGPFKTVLALPPGPQNRSMVQAILKPWADEFTANGWLVVSPVAPDGTMFFKGSEAHIPVLLDHVAAELPADDGKRWLFGISNGGVSAFRVATLYPERFRSMTVIPGVPRRIDQERLAQLAELKVNLVVGGDDTGWTTGSHETKKTLKTLGVDVLLKVYEGQGHSAFASVDWATLEGWLTR